MRAAVAEDADLPVLATEDCDRLIADGARDRLGADQLERMRGDIPMVTQIVRRAHASLPVAAFPRASLADLSPRRQRAFAPGRLEPWGRAERLLRRGATRFAVVFRAGS